MKVLKQLSNTLTLPTTILDLKIYSMTYYEKKQPEYIPLIGVAIITFLVDKVEVYSIQNLARDYQ